MLLKPDSGIATWIGYQILFPAGIGMSLEQSNLAIQSSLPPHQIPAGISLAIFTRGLGGALAISIAQNVFESNLKSNLHDILPDLDTKVITGSGATDLISNIRALVGGDEEMVSRIVGLYNGAVVKCFMVALILASLTLPAGLLVEWKSVKRKEKVVEGVVEVAGEEEGAKREERV